jgi:hypothetical protein
MCENQGWETRVLGLWLQNSQGLYFRFKGRVEELLGEHLCYADHGEEAKGEATAELAKEIAAYFEEWDIEGPVADPLTEIVQACLNDVDWHELADDFIEE